MRLADGDTARSGPSRSIRFGIIGHGPRCSAWQARCIEELLRLPYVDLALFVVPPDESRASRRFRTTRRDALLFKATLGLRPPRALKPIDLSSTVGHVPSVAWRSPRGEVLRSEDETDSGRIRKYDLDFILQFAPGIVDRDVVSAARYGVWAFRFDDPERYRGTPPCFWEIYNGDPVNGAALERLTADENIRVVLRRGYFRTSLHSLRSNIDEVHFGSARFPANVCEDIRVGHTAYLDAPPSPSSASVIAAPTNIEMARFLARQSRHAIRRVQGGLLRHEDWSIGIVNRPIGSFLEPHGPADVRWLRPPGHGRFIADPFGVEIDGEVRILYEDFEYRSSKGVIATVKATDPGPSTPPEIALQLPVHASYPYLFVDHGETFCIPESHEAREVAIYRAVDFPTRWEKYATILRGPAALDATVFRNGGRWWLTCTDLDAGQYVHLYIYHATNLEGPWESHALNPVKSDIRSARPAGTPFVHEGELYRPAQDCSRTYGGRITVNRILRLTPDEFVEETAAMIDPFSDSPFPDGIHTISAVGDITLIDGKRHRFIPSAIPYVLRNADSGSGA